jgi:hypothetical protein
VKSREDRALKRDGKYCHKVKVDGFCLLLVSRRVCTNSN